MLLLLLAFLQSSGGACDSGKTLFEAKAYAAAQEPLWTCVGTGTADKDAAHRLALTLRELKNYADGFARVRAVPDSLDKQYLEAFLYFRTGNTADSLRVLEKAYQRDKADWRIHHLFALNYVVLNIKDGAEASLRNAIRLRPDNAELYYQLARLYYTDNRPRESILASGQALAIFAEYPEVYNNMGLCHEALAENAIAAEKYLRAIELNRKLDRKDEWPLLNYAAFLIKLGEANGSLPFLHEALKIREQSAKAHYLLGRALAKVGRPAEAKAALKQAIELDGKEPSAYFELGMLLQREGDRSGARANLGRFEALRKGAGQ